MKRENKLKWVMAISACVAIISFAAAGSISGGMIPYQDPSPELLQRYIEYVKTYTPIWNALMVICLISAVIFAVSAIRLVRKGGGMSEVD